MTWKLPLATFVAYLFQVDLWIIYFGAMVFWYYEIVMLVAEHCGNGCNIPTLIGKLG